MTALRSSLRSSILALATCAGVIGMSPEAHAQTKGAAKPPATAKPAAAPTTPAKPSATSASAPAKPAASAERDAIKAAAADLFDRGAKAMEEERWEDCRASFLAAYRIDSYYQIAGSLAVCEAKLGKYPDAVEHLTYALRAMPATAPAERRTSAEKLLAEVRPKVSEVTIRTNKAGAEVFLDGRSLGRSPLSGPVFLEAGAHKLEAKLESATAHAEVTATGGGTQEVTVPFEEPKKVEPPQRSLVPAYVMGGAALVGFGVGGGLLGAWAGKRSDVKATSESIRSAGHSCVTGAANFDAQCAALASDARTAETLNRAGIGALVGGGVLAAAAAGYLLFWPRSLAGQASAGQHVSVVPVVSSNGAAALVQGTF